jgi:hypothetical protein
VKLSITKLLVFKKRLKQQKKSQSCVKIVILPIKKLLVFFSLDKDYQIYIRFARNAHLTVDNTITHSSLLTVGCGGHGYVYNNETGLCVSYAYTVTTAGKWDIQKTRCEERGQTLMSVDTVEKLRFLQDIIKSAISCKYVCLFA